MQWNKHLRADEEIVWQGRPAPRCYTFRNWIHSLFGLVILIAAIGWMIYGLHLADVYQQLIYAWFPIPFLMAGAWLAFGHLIYARLEWERVYYAMTNQRVLAVRRRDRPDPACLDLDEIIYFQLRPLGSELGTVRIHSRDRARKLILSCIEYPRRLTDLLEVEMEKRGIDVNSGPDE